MNAANWPGNCETCTTFPLIRLAIGFALHSMQYASNLNTSARGAHDYGLFQITDGFWCSADSHSHSYGKRCKLDCDKWLDNDISDDLACAQKLVAQHGFRAAWSFYDVIDCGTQSVEIVRECFGDNHNQDNTPAHNHSVFLSQGLND